MVVQLFVTVSLATSFLGQGVIVCLLLRCPMEWILRFEWQVSIMAWALNAITGNVSISNKLLVITGFINETNSHV
jgi:hypothetical protein